MARGRDRHQAHEAAVAALGRGLSRRAGSRCELCGADSGLRVVEVDGGPPEPDPEWAVLSCRRCIDAMGPKGRWAAGELRFLETTIWSDVIPAQIAAVRLARRVADAGEPWASEVLDGLYLEPEIESLL